MSSVISKGGLFGYFLDKATKKEEPKDTSLSDTEMSIIADDEARRKAKKRKEVTKTVLTSPLGASPTNTSKLGG